MLPRRRNDDDEGEADGPRRTCALTRELHDRAELIRFVRSPDGEVVADIRNRLPGRGVWIKAARTTICEAARRKVFDRGFREATRVAPDLAGRLDDQLEQDALGMLAMANKAGVLVAGFGKVSDEIAAGSLAVLVHAADAAPDGVRKLDGAVRRSGLAVARVNLFPSDRLGLALGRSNVIHAALKSSAAGEAFVQRCRRLQAFRGETDFDTDKVSGQGPGTDVE